MAAADEVDCGLSWDDIADGDFLELAGFDAVVGVVDHGPQEDVVDACDADRDDLVFGPLGRVACCLPGFL